MDAKQRGILGLLGILGLMIFLVGGMATGAISARRFEEQDATVKKVRPEFDPQFLYNRAIQAYQRGEREMARELAVRVTYLNPKYILAYDLLAAIALRENKWQDAIANCRKMLEIDPTSNTARLSLAFAYRGSGKPDVAEQLYRDVITNPRSTDKEREEAHLQLSDMAHASGSISPAKTAPTSPKGAGR